MFEKEEGKSIDPVQKGSEDSGVKVVELKERQKEATMDQNICMLLSDQLRQEELPALGVKQCVYQTDCAGCEHTPMPKAVKMSNNQVDHIIGQKQTQKMQSIDLIFAKLGKDRQRATAPAIRRAQREKALQEGCPAILTSKCTEIMLLLNDMHDACQAAATDERLAVVKAARMGGFLEFLPTAQGLKPVEGDCRLKAGLDSGSCRRAFFHSGILSLNFTFYKIFAFRFFHC